MNLRQLTYFATIAEEGSFTRAAERLMIAQPSLSQQIKALEAEVGGALLERLPKGVRLTAAGKLFLPEAQAAVRHAERAGSAARRALGCAEGELEVATVTSIACGVLPGPFERWHAAHPATTVRLHEYAHRRELEHVVHGGVGDIAVGPRPPDWSGPVVPLGWEQFVLVLPPGDPLGGRNGPIAIESLADREWVLFPADHGLHDLTAFICAGAGFAPRGTVHTNQVAAAASLAAAGLGVALLPASIVPDAIGPVRKLKKPLVYEVVAYTRREFSPPAEAFLAILQDATWTAPPPNAAVVAA